MAMLHNAVKSEAMPIDQTCLCCSKVADFRCRECGPLVYYCYDGLLKQHTRINHFHVAEKWEDDHYQTFLFEPRKVNVRPSHICDSSKEIPITCINEQGVEINLLVSRWKKAESIYTSSMETFSKLTETYDGGFISLLCNLYR